VGQHGQGRHDAGRGRPDDAPGDLVLNGEEVGEIAIVAVRTSTRSRDAHPLKEPLTRHVEGKGRLPLRGRLTSPRGSGGLPPMENPGADLPLLDRAARTASMFHTGSSARER
jgi:hypothetical protein